ncbi:MAG: DNA polymerase III subunit chi [Pseudomonadota bacterium]
MAEVLFYHLEQSRLEDVLPGLLQRTLERGWRAMVKTPSDEMADAIDDHLWTFLDDSFLPHGCGEDDDDQPVWITSDDGSGTTREVLFLVGGADVPTEVHKQFTRSVLLFDGSFAPAAREVWKAVKGAQLKGTYWRQSAGGRWEQAG